MPETPQDGIQECFANQDDVSTEKGTAGPMNERSPLTDDPEGTFSEKWPPAQELHRLRCHKCGTIRYVIGDLEPDPELKGLTRCPRPGCGAGEAELDGFGGVDDRPPDAEFIRVVEDRDFDMAAAMIAAGADIHCNEETPLRWAAARGDREMVEFLLDHGADLTAGDYKALRWAYLEKHENVVNLLIDRGADPEVLEDQSHVETLSASTVSEDAHRWWGCPLCGTYIDALVEGRIINPDRLKCPKCGCMNLNLEDGDHFLPGRDKLAPDIITGTLPPDFAERIKDVRATLDEVGMFHTEDHEKEPKWPKDLAAVMLVAATMGKQEAVQYMDRDPVPFGAIVYIFKDDPVPDGWTTAPSADVAGSNMYAIRKVR